MNVGPLARAALLLFAAACVSQRTLSATDEPPSSVTAKYAVGSVEPLGFSADLSISAPGTLSASVPGAMSSTVYRYPMGAILEHAFGDYFVPSLFSVPFEGEVGSAFRVEVALKQAKVDLRTENATAEVDLEVRVLGSEYKEELFRRRVKGSGQSDFSGDTVPEAVWTAAFDAAEEALFAAAQDPRIASYRSEEPLYEFQSSGPKWVVGVVPFQVAEKKAGLDESVTSIVTGQLFDDLSQRRDRISILEMEKLEALMEEQRFQSSGFTKEVVAQMGNALGARFMIFGTVSYHANQYTITFRMVDVETREIIASPAETSTKAAPKQLARVTRKVVNVLLARLDKLGG